MLNAPHLVRPETQRRVREAIEALGYRASQAARQMRTRRSRLIAVRIDPAGDGINGSILDRFLHGLAETAAPASYRVLLYAAADDAAEIATFDDLLSAYDLDAFVLTSTHHADPRTTWLAERKIPFVTFGRPWDALDRHPWVDVDGAWGTAAATAHLIAAGHRRVGYLGWPAGSGVGDDRRSGWVRAMGDAGLPIHGLEIQAADGVPEGAASAASLLELPDPPTALVCCSDSLAVGALQAVRGNAADPVAVIGFDDTPVAHAVGLSSVAQPLAEAADHCVRLLVDLLDAPRRTEPDWVLLKPSLVLRQSG